METISDTVYHKIKEAIISRDEKILEDINEIRISELLSTSRTPVRDALRRLVQEGLLVKNKRGYSIIKISSDDVRMLYEVRTTLEGLAAELAAQRSTEDEREEMTKIMQEIEKGVDYSAEQLAELNGTFHEIVAGASHNKYLFEELQGIRNKLKIVRITLFTSYEKKEQEMREHRKIYDAIIARDPKKARKAALDHQISASEFAVSKFYLFQ